MHARFEAKLLSWQQCLDALKSGRLARPLVFTNGVFDILHRGHITYLDTSAQLGASLLVAVNTDKSVRKLAKGQRQDIQEAQPAFPLQKPEERARVPEASLNVPKEVFKGFEESLSVPKEVFGGSEESLSVPKEVFGVSEESLRASKETMRASGSPFSVHSETSPRRPINSQQDRAALLAALACVDAVTTFDEATPEVLIRMLRPDIIVKGGDYDMEALPETALVKSWGGEAVAVPFVFQRSTTTLLQKIRGDSR